MTSCTVTTKDALQFYDTDRVGLGITSPTCLNGSQAIPYSGTSAVPPPETGREEGVLQNLLNGTKILSYAWDDALDEKPLLLEGIFVDQHRLSEGV